MKQRQIVLNSEFEGGPRWHLVCHKSPDVQFSKISWNNCQWKNDVDRGLHTKLQQSVRSLFLIKKEPVPKLQT